MAGDGKIKKRKQTKQPVKTIVKKRLTKATPTTPAAAIPSAAIPASSDSSEPPSSDSDDSLSLPPASLADDSSPVTDSDDDEDSSGLEPGSDKIRKLLEPFSKEQLVDFIADTAVKESALYKRIVDMADSDVTHRKLFVHGLCWNTTRETLIEAFQSYGEVEDVKLVMDKVTGKVKGFAFVTFKTRKGAEKALKEPRKKILNRVTSCQLASLGSVPPQQNQDTSGRKIYISNLQHDVDAEKLRSYFVKFGEIEAGPMGFDMQTGKCRGFALFLYKTEDGARKALAEPYKVFDGHQLHCQKAAEGKNKAQAVVGAQPVQTPVFANMAAAQTMMINPLYGRMIANPNAGFFGGPMNPMMVAGAFNPAMMPNAQVGVNGAMGLGGYGVVTPSMLGNYGSNPSALGLQQAYPSTQIGQLPQIGQTSSVRGSANGGSFPGYLSK